MVVGQEGKWRNWHRIEQFSSLAIDVKRAVWFLLRRWTILLPEALVRPSSPLRIGSISERWNAKHLQAPCSDSRTDGAAGNGREGLVKLLLAKDGSCLDSKDIHRQSALSSTAGNGRDGVVKLLLVKDGMGMNSEDTGFHGSAHATAARNPTKNQ